VTPESAPDNHDDEPRRRLRRALTSGALFRVARKSRVGRGSGKLCAVCTSAVGEDDVEYEVPGGIDDGGTGKLTLSAPLADYTGRQRF